MNMKPVLEWTDVRNWHEANVGELLSLEVRPCEVRQEWDWAAFSAEGYRIGEGTDDGRGVEHAKAQAEAFAREWIAAQAAALSPGQWTSAIPTDGRHYWIRTGDPTTDPETWTPRVEYIDSRNRTLFWGEFFQCWSVPVSLPEVK